MPNPIVSTNNNTTLSGLDKIKSTGVEKLTQIIENFKKENNLATTPETIPSKTEFKGTEKYRSDPQPLRIVFLTGKYQGKAFGRATSDKEATHDLGINIQEFSSSASANWNEGSGESQGIAVGATFKNLSARKISLELDLYCLEEDVQHYVENLYHLLEIDRVSGKAVVGAKTAPPLLRLSIGMSVFDPVFCTSISDKRSGPMHESGDYQGGFYHATVSLEFQTLDGKGSTHQNGEPRADTPLKRDYASQTQEERQKEGSIKVAEETLADCLSPDENKELIELLKNEGISDFGRLSGISDNGFLQWAIAGGLKTEDFADSTIQSKLNQSVANRIIATEPGLQNLSQAERDAIALALISGDGSGLASEIAFDRLHGTYTTLTTAIKNQDLNNDSDIFGSGETYSDDRDTIVRIGGCGLQLRGTGLPIQPAGQASANTEAMNIESINHLLANKQITDKQLIEILSLPKDTPETVVRQIRNAYPYKNKADFIAKVKSDRMGITGYGAWNSFDKEESANLENLNTLISNPETTKDQIKEAFGITDDNLAETIKNSGTGFTNKQQFIDTLVKSGKTEGQSYQLWVDYWRKQNP